MEYSIEDGMICLGCTGSRDIATVADVLDRALADPDCPERVSIFEDSRDTDLTQVDLEGSAIQAWAQEFASRGSRIHRLAILVQPGATFGLARMAASYAELAGVEAQAFVVEEEARAWLREGLSSSQEQSA